MDICHDNGSRREKALAKFMKIYLWTLACIVGFGMTSLRADSVIELVSNEPLKIIVKTESKADLNLDILMYSTIDGDAFFNKQLVSVDIHIEKPPIEHLHYGHAISNVHGGVGIFALLLGGKAGPSSGNCTTFSANISNELLKQILKESKSTLNKEIECLLSMKVVYYKFGEKDKTLGLARVPLIVKFVAKKKS